MLHLQEALFAAKTFDVIDDEEFILLHDLNRSDNIDFQHDVCPDFELENFSPKKQEILLILVEPQGKTRAIERQR